MTRDLPFDLLVLLLASVVLALLIYSICGRPSFYVFLTYNIEHVPCIFFEEKQAPLGVAFTGQETKSVTWDRTQTFYMTGGRWRRVMTGGPAREDKEIGATLPFSMPSPR